MAQVAAAATAKLPECNGRIECCGQTGLSAGRDARARRHRHGGRQRLRRPEGLRGAAGLLFLQDFDRAPHGGLCKHRLAAAILRRAQSLMVTGEVIEDAEPEPPAAPAPALLPESLLPYERSVVSGTGARHPEQRVVAAKLS